jgi:hypothetical protein
MAKQHILHSNKADSLRFGKEIENDSGSPSIVGVEQ